MSADLTRLKQSFGSIANLYDAVRPSYPDSIVQRILQPFPNPQALHILEAGCGSGQATELFARTGAQILATDISTDLIALAKKRVANFPNVQFQISPFETFQPNTTFDLLISAQAFHWIPTEIGLPKAAQLIRPNGRIALFWNYFRYDADPTLQKIRDIIIHHIPLFARYPDASDAEYESFATQWVDELNASKLFRDVVCEIVWSEKSYTVAEYLALVESYSWFQTQDESVKRDLVNELREEFEARMESVRFPVKTLLVAGTT